MAKRASDMLAPARALALELTKEVRVRDAYARELVNARREACHIDPRDFDFTQVLVYGVVLCLGSLDEAIDRSLSSPRDIKPNVRDALRISAFELLFLKKPDHVVVSQGVELVRSIAPRAAGLANAVLRKMTQDAKEFPWGDPETDNAAMARSYGAPLWLTERLIREYGREETTSILEACLEPAPRYICENPFIQNGTFASDLSAQHVASLVPLDAPILEIGAGRGTKTMLIESRAFMELGHTVPIHAIDLHEYRVDIIARRMEEAGIADVVAIAADARDLSETTQLAFEYPTVFVDAPCTGTGTMRRHPEIRWRLRPEDVDDLCRLQGELLEEASKRVAPGGTLVYATCSILYEENQGVANAFLDGRAPGSWETVEMFGSLPEAGGPDGHFAIVMRRHI